MKSRLAEEALYIFWVRFEEIPSHCSTSQLTKDQNFGWLSVKSASENS